MPLEKGFQREGELLSLFFTIGLKMLPLFVFGSSRDALQAGDLLPKATIKNSIEAGKAPCARVASFQIDLTGR
jgi:hypothetical protein